MFEGAERINRNALCPVGNMHAVKFAELEHENAVSVNHEASAGGICHNIAAS
jgi:hypothetical protein